MNLKTPEGDIHAKRNIKALFHVMILGVFLIQPIVGVLAPTSAIAAGLPLSQVQWKQTMLTTPAPGAGCFVASYPSIIWTLADCAPQPANPAPYTVGAGTDTMGHTSTKVIYDATGSPTSVSGYSSEHATGSGVCGDSNHDNCYSIQENTNQFSTTYHNVYDARVWQQFIYSNNASLTHGQVFMEYWMYGYVTTAGSCPLTHPHIGPWHTSGADCWADSNRTNTAALEDLSSMLNFGLAGAASNGGNDAVSFCNLSDCATSSVTDSAVLSLGADQEWNSVEFNFFGNSAINPQADFNTGMSLSINVALADSNLNSIAPSTFTSGLTGETNDFNLGTPSTDSQSYTINESN